jgi:hypothetical protein
VELHGLKQVWRQKIIKGLMCDMSEIVEQCLLCGDTRQKIFDQREFKGFPVISQVCTRCGLVYQSPRMTAGELDAFYEKEYRQLYQGAEGPTQKDTRVQAERAELLLSFLENALETPDRVLDIGTAVWWALNPGKRTGHSPGKKV